MIVRRHGLIAFLVGTMLTVGTLTSVAAAAEATAPQAMVATVTSSATDAGVAALQAGGNAVDAAVAAAVTLGVVDGYNSGLGGDIRLFYQAAIVQVAVR